MSAVFCPGKKVDDAGPGPCRCPCSRTWRPKLRDPFLSPSQHVSKSTCEDLLDGGRNVPVRSNVRLPDAQCEATVCARARCLVVRAKWSLRLGYPVKRKCHASSSCSVHRNGTVCEDGVAAGTVLARHVTAATCTLCTLCTLFC
jgi:hypothetical protein